MTLSPPLLRSLLFVPGDRADRFDKAASSGAHGVLLDLEDAVSADRKNIARDAVASWVSGRSGNTLPQTIVRINAVDADWHAEDLRLVAQLPPEVGVMLPKSEPDTLPAVAAAIGSRCLYALVETAVGVLGLQAMATTAGVYRLAFGNVDYGLDTGIVVNDDEIELAAVRTAFVLASRAAALPAPIDGVSLETTDQARMAGDAVRAKRFGFGGKLCIHPCQVNSVNAAFHPSAAEMEWARGVMAAFESAGGGVVSYLGKMVDRPVAERARRILLQT